MCPAGRAARGCSCVLGLTELAAPRDVSEMLSQEPGDCITPGCVWAGRFSDPQKSSPGVSLSPSRSWVPALALGPAQPTWNSFSISSGFTCPGFTCPTLPGSGQQSCLGPYPGGGAPGLCSAPWQQLEVSSPGLFSSERCFHTHSVLIALLMWHRETSSPSSPHATAPFPPLGGWNLVLPPQPPQPPRPLGHKARGRGGEGRGGSS